MRPSSAVVLGGRRAPRARAGAANEFAVAAKAWAHRTPGPVGFQKSA
jgi:hypothetical protein